MNGIELKPPFSETPRRTTKLPTVLMTLGCCACQGSSKSAGHEATRLGDSQAPRDNTEQLEVHVLYRERMVLPSTVTVTNAAYTQAFGANGSA